MLVISSPQQCLAPHPPPAEIAVPVQVLLPSCLIATKIPHSSLSLCYKPSILGLGYDFPYFQTSFFFIFSPPKCFHQGLALSPGLSSGIALPAKSGARFLCSGGCSLLSVCRIDPLIGDLLQGCLMAVFFPIMDIFWKVCSFGFLSSCSLALQEPCRGIQPGIV